MLSTDCNAAFSSRLNLAVGVLHALGEEKWAVSEFLSPPPDPLLLLQA